MTKSLSRLIILLMLVGQALVFAQGGDALKSPDFQPAMPIQVPVISIIIDDLGNRLRDGKRAVDLPGEITYSILPHLPYSKQLAERAHAANKEIMLHLPMEAKNGKALGPGGLTQCMDELEFKTIVHANFRSVPHVKGFNNHMGSWLTEHPQMMSWVMQAAMFQGDFYFVDSRTSSKSVAVEHAEKRGITATQRDIFLDYEDDSGVIEAQLHALIKRAKRKGSAVAIGHPYKKTLAALEAWLPTLEARGVKLVPVSKLITIRKQRRRPSWQMSSSPSLKVAKSSKPSP